jgi:hypothetical protein
MQGKDAGIETKPVPAGPLDSSQVRRRGALRGKCRETERNDSSILPKASAQHKMKTINLFC